MNYILFDDKNIRKNLLPITFTKPISEIRYGITTIKEKWQALLNTNVSTISEDYLSKKYPTVIVEDNILINSCFYPEKNVLDEIHKLKQGQGLYYLDRLLAYRQGFEGVYDYDNLEKVILNNTSKEILILENVWDLFSDLNKTIIGDFKNITKGRKSMPISSSNHIIGDFEIFIEEGARVEFAYLNASEGPIYIGKNAEIMEAAVIRGPVSIGESSTLRPHTKVYGPTSIGPHSKIGGEVGNILVMGYSNKAHDGYLGNSVIGEWCNLGAGTNSSNLKNTYDNVRIWNYKKEEFVDTGLQFCGLIMGDHSKTAINSMLNTGTVVGVSVNLFGAGFPRTFVKSFNWGGALGFKKYNFEKSCSVAEKVYARRGKVFDKTEREIFEYIFNNTSKF